jgi:hypothetical protein
MYPLKFNEADLNANRQGVLSDAQRKRIDADVETILKYSKYMMLIFGLCIALVVVVTFVGEYRSVNGDLSQLLSQNNLTGFGIMAMMFIVIYAILIVWNRWSVMRLSQGEVMSVEGTAEAVSTYSYARGGRYPMHRVYLHRGWFRRFTLYFPTAEPLRHFKQGRLYRVYYVRYAMPYPLSVEEIDEKDKRS